MQRILSLLLLGSAAAAGPIVQTENGPLEGLKTDTCKKWLGVPFAKPPVGALRWKNPVKPTSWAPDTRQATRYSDGCPQNCNLPPMTCPQTQSEDCLYLNVFTPLNSQPGDKRAVLFFMPGGRYEQGSAMTQLYDGDYLAQKHDVIVVVTNYRLGALGFLVTDEITGQFGMLDQRMGLQWVHDNIAAFGGDPANVMLFGQSAGGTSTGTHLVSPKTPDNLFASAIMISNPVTLHLKDRADALVTAEAFAKDLGCGTQTNTTCLMHASVRSIVDSQNKAASAINIDHFLEFFYPWTPYIDGIQLPDQPITMFLEGRAKAVPLMLGNVADDARIFIYEGLAKPLPSWLYDTAIPLIFSGGDAAKTILNMYPASNSSDARDALAVLGTDYLFACPARAIATAHAKRGLPTYHYEYSHVASFDPWFANQSYCAKAVCHGIDLPFIFGTAEGGGFHYTQAELELVKNMQSFYGNFATSHDPNTGTPVGLQWPKWSAANETMVLNQPLVINPEYRDTQCNMWDRLGYHFG